MPTVENKLSDFFVMYEIFSLSEERAGEGVGGGGESNRGDIKV